MSELNRNPFVSPGDRFATQAEVDAMSEDQWAIYKACGVFQRKHGGAQPDSLLAVARDADELLSLVKRMGQAFSALAVLNVDLKPEARKQCAALAAESYALVKRLEKQ